MHLTDDVLAAVRAAFGNPAVLRWAGDVSDAEWALATYDPRRTHDVTLFILDPDGRIALIRKPHFADGVWRPPGGGIRPQEPFVDGAVREAREETGLDVTVERYLVATRATFRNGGRELEWATHVLLARTMQSELEPSDGAEIAGARWGTPAELAGPLRERLLATGRAFWRYRVALHDAALAQLRGV